ncbi:MucB/RseB-like sigma(E) regulatory protein [Mesocricetibacter intestinalis]|uniref:MucB/RseB-like sigma(E) regulatory protein n=1 Tax=Mesocricetibacter intestinalis TaxID=1521930 RepID=A0A4R6V9W3_9PAST|nr:sigma-E factor regulatory protein RseB [Mesocricetibacter intestinalis]TDQ56631.1 MucB/RseB-like sigma(E) regulatory protein [Mesocricetibacter intestinalis]
MSSIFRNFIVFPAILIFSSAVFAQTALSPLQRLNEMSRAKDQLSYEYTFVQFNPTSADTLRYQHVNLKGKSYAQLLNLEGTKQEIILRDDLISYFHPNYQSFTIQGKQIVDHLPNVMATDFNQLARYYDFVDLGRNRIADRVVQAIRILPKDNFRYQYVVFVDEENHLLLGSDMLDRDGNLLERFRVVTLYVGEELNPLSDYLNNIRRPAPMLSIRGDSNQPLGWRAGWVPEGFKLINRNVESDNNDRIESSLYSDGLFFFTLYVSDELLPNMQENVWKQGSYTIYSETINNKEVTLIGQLPLSTAKRIIKDIIFNK